MLKTGLAAALCFCVCVLPLQAGKLDIDIYASIKIPSRPSAQPHGFKADSWTAGDPRDLRGVSPWVEHVSHAGYAGMAIAGLVGCAAGGLVAPAVGFGIVMLVHLWRGGKTFTKSK